MHADSKLSVERGFPTNLYSTVRDSIENVNANIYLPYSQPILFRESFFVGDVIIMQQILARLPDWPAW